MVSAHAQQARGMLAVSLGVQALDQPDRAQIASGVFQINALKLCGSQAHCVYCYEINR